MEFVKVESQQIAEVGFAEPDTLGIRFKTKAGFSEYHYAGVSPRTHQALMAAPSIGTYFGQNIKSKPEKYPFSKVEVDAKPVIEAKGEAENVWESKPGDPAPAASLAVIDTLTDDKLFAAGGVTDAQIAGGREWYLAEAAKYSIETEEKRMALKRFARPLQKLRTGIEARAKEFTGATKRKIAAIDTEKRRLVMLVGGIEDEVLAPLTKWEQEENARIEAENMVARKIESARPHLYATIPELEKAIADIEAITGLRAYLEASKALTLQILRSDLERRKVAEAEQAELARLRAEAAERAEQDRLDAVAKAAVEAARKTIREEVIAEIQAQPEEERFIASTPVLGRPIGLAEAQRQYKIAESGPYEDTQGRMRMEAIDALSSHIPGLKSSDAALIVRAIGQGLIPHLTITY
jgi:hypothetical protein